MKKQLEAELISIAHRILKLSNKTDLAALHQEAGNLYEALSVLKFAEQNLTGTKPTIGYKEVEEAIEQNYKPQGEAVLDKPINSFNNVEVLAASADEQVTEKAVPEIFTPTIDLVFEPKPAEEQVPSAAAEHTLMQPEILFDNMLPAVEPIFENTVEHPEASIAFDLEPLPEEPVAKQQKAAKNKAAGSKSTTLNDKLAKGINVGLNDRIAFVKHLFHNSNEDYNRVLSQLITFDSFTEAKAFIDDMVKPDYDNWSGKEEYADRFMEVVEKKFS